MSSNTTPKSGLSTPSCCRTAGDVSPILIGDQHWAQPRPSSESRVVAYDAGCTRCARCPAARRALYVQQSVCLLPDRPEVARAVRRLAVKVRAEGGSARVLPVQVSDPAERERLVEEMRAGVQVEYGEVLERLPSFFAELDTETARGNVTFAEVAESEAELARFESWLAKIAARDYFAAPLGGQVRAELDRARAALQSFEAAALAADTSAKQAAPAARSTARGLHSIRTNRR